MNELKFDPGKHEYFLDGKRIPSVTQIINSILPPFQVDDWYLQRGTAVHACAAYIARGKDFDYDERIAGQVEALRKFFKEVKPEVLAVEQLLCSKAYRFAGTLDLYAVVSGKYVLIDYKGTCDLERGSLQLAAYSLMMSPVVTTGILIEINADGKYKMTKPIKIRPYTNKFLALRSVYGIRERMGYNKQKEESCN